MARVKNLKIVVPVGGGYVDLTYTVANSKGRRGIIYKEQGFDLTLAISLQV